MECLGRNDVQRDDCLSIFHISYSTLSRQSFFKKKKNKNKKKMETFLSPHYEKRSGPPTQTRGDQQLQGLHDWMSIDPGSIVRDQ